MSLVLVSASGDRRFPRTGRTRVIAGRALSCTLPILNPAVSRRHADLRVTESATVAVHDLTSRNGRWVNGARVQRATVVPGDTLAFGTVAFTAALDMQRALDSLNARGAAEGRPLLGDTVNVANRLCRLAAGGEILVSDAVRDALSDPNGGTPRRELAVARPHGIPPAVWQVMSTGAAL